MTDKDMEGIRIGRKEGMKDAIRITEKERNDAITIKGIEKRQYYASACHNIISALKSALEEKKK